MLTLPNLQAEKPKGTTTTKLLGFRWVFRLPKWSIMWFHLTSIRLGGLGWHEAMNLANFWLLTDWRFVSEQLSQTSQFLGFVTISPWCFWCIIYFQDGNGWKNVTDMEPNTFSKKDFGGFHHLRRGDFFHPKKTWKPFPPFSICLAKTSSISHDKKRDMFLERWGKWWRFFVSPQFLREGGVSYMYGASYFYTLYIYYMDTLHQLLLGKLICPTTHPRPDRQWG